MVKNEGPGAFQQQSGSEQGSEPQKEQKLSNPPPCLEPILSVFWDWFLGLFWNPLFSFFWQNRSAKWDQNGVPFWDVGPSSSVVNNGKISLFGALDGAPFLGSLPRPLKIKLGSNFEHFWEPKKCTNGGLKWDPHFSTIRIWKKGEVRIHRAAHQRV